RARRDRPGLAAGSLGRTRAIPTLDQRSDVPLEGLPTVRRDRRPRDELFLEGVHEAAVLDDAVVEMRPRGETGRADATDHLALLDVCARTDLQPRQVVVHRLVASLVRQRDAQPVPARPAGRLDNA